MRPKINRDLFTFKAEWRVRFCEVDLQGVVHHSEIIKYLEKGRVEYWRELGIGYQDFLDSGLQYVVAKVECNYIKPLLFDKMISMMVRVAKLSRTSITYEYLIINDNDDCAVYASTILVCLREGGDRPYPLPEDYLNQILEFEADESIEQKISRKVAAKS
ncbi:MAG: acyl-CoA thioesterase [candidate division Zixibacteria bacterium]|nr:acyl-CoA thioesterase [candidate division Zixibacteria bacterium]